MVTYKNMEINPERLNQLEIEKREKAERFAFTIPELIKKHSDEMLEYIKRVPLMIQEDRILVRHRNPWAMNSSNFIAN